MALLPNDAAWLSIFRQQMDDMFNYVFHMKEHGSGPQGFLPQLDLYETSDCYVVEIDLPGFFEKDFTLSIQGQMLRIEGVKRQEKSACKMSYICLERHFGRFCRNLEIPVGFDVNAIRAQYERGVLRVSFPRVNAEDHSVRTVAVSEGA